MTKMAPPREDYVTAHDLFFGDLSDNDAADALSAALASFEDAGTAITAVGPLSSAAGDAVKHELGVAADALLDLDLGDALVAGWLKYDELLQAGRRTLGSGAREVVELVSHRVTSTYTPRVDLYVDDLRVSTLKFQLDLVFHIVGCAAVVASGDLVAVQGGDVNVTGTVSLQGARLITRTRQLPTHLVVNLRHPVPLARLSTRPEEDRGEDDRSRP